MQVTYYHRPQSTRFHIKKCILLEGDGIKKYHKVDNEDIKEEGLLPCPICLCGTVGLANLVRK